MHRRAFLKTSALLPAWAAAVARAQEPDGDGPPRRTEALLAAWREARRSGRPLLLLVVPAPPEGERWLLRPYQPQPDALRERGLVWGQVLHHGPDEVLADFALCVLACATLEEARRTLPASSGVAAIEGEPLAVLVESDLGGAAPVEVALEPIEAPLPWLHGEADPEALQAEYERQVSARIAAIGDALRPVVAPNAAALARRAALARDALPRLPEPVLAAEPDDALRALVARAPAVVREAAERSPHRAVAVGLLAAYARENALATSPAGSLWGESTGCGMRVEGLGAGHPMVACGMGHVPALGRRFLYFYTSD